MDTKREVLMIALPYLEIVGPEGQSFRAEIKTDRLTIGRFEQWNDVALFPDPQQLISRKVHCTIEHDQHAWWIVDNGSTNRTFLCRKRESMEIVYGRAQLRDGDSIRILGKILEEERQYWELIFHDPAITNPAGYTDTLEEAPVLLEYHWIEARLYRTENGDRQEIRNLRPQEHKLIRYMAQRNRANDGEPVLCSFEELTSAVWGRRNAPTRCRPCPARLAATKKSRDRL